MIAHYKGDNLLNKKGEWGNNLPSTLEVEDRNGNRRKQHQDTQRGSQPPKKRPRIEDQVQEDEIGPQEVQEQETPLTKRGYTREYRGRTT